MSDVDPEEIPPTTRHPQNVSSSICIYEMAAEFFERADVDELVNTRILYRLSWSHEQHLRLQYVTCTGNSFSGTAHVVRRRASVCNSNGTVQDTA